MHPIHPAPIDRFRRRLLLAPLLLALPALTRAQGASAAAGADIGFTADWSVRLERDGTGSDASGARLLALLSALGGTDGIASAQDVVQLPAGDSGAYRISSTLTPRGALATLLKRLRWLRSAAGTLRDGVPHLAVATNQRGDDPRLTARREGSRLLLQEGSGEVRSISAPAAVLDALSWQWGYLRRPVPTAAFDQPLLIKDRVMPARVVPQPTTLAWNGQNAAVVLLDAQTPDSAARLRVWLRRSDGLPLQVALGLGERYGLDVIQTLQQVPAGL